MDRRARVKNAVRRLMEYLRLRVRFGDEHACQWSPPDDEVDHVWHHLILQTELYQRLCHEMIGAFVHHAVSRARDVGTYDRMISRERTRQAMGLSPQHNEQQLEAYKDEAARLAAGLTDVGLRTLTGRIYVLWVRMGKTTAFELKGMYQDLVCVPPEQMRLIWAGRQWQDDEVIDVARGTVFTVVYKLRGC
jgi:hypothetical protein